MNRETQAPVAIGGVPSGLQEEGGGGRGLCCLAKGMLNDSQPLLCLAMIAPAVAQLPR